MKATRKKEYSEKRIRKATAHEISEMNLSKYNETKIVQKLVSIKVNDKTIIQVTESKFNKYGKIECIERWKKQQPA